MSKTGINPDGTVRQRADQLARSVYVRDEVPAGGGQLNPDWVEWLMGWPVGWSSLAPLPSIENWLTSYNWAEEPPNVPRVCGKVPDRVARLKAIGNGQVPQCVVLAWHLLAP